MCIPSDAFADQIGISSSIVTAHSWLLCQGKWWWECRSSSRPPALHYVVNFRAGSIFILKQCKTFGKWCLLELHLLINIEHMVAGNKESRDCAPQSPCLCCVVHMLRKKDMRRSEKGACLVGGANHRSNDWAFVWFRGLLDADTDTCMSRSVVNYFSGDVAVLLRLLHHLCLVFLPPSYLPCMIAACTFRIEREE